MQNPQQGATGAFEVESFKTLELAMKRINEIRGSFSIQPEKAPDSEDANADEGAHVWLISVSPNEDADKLYFCTDGKFR